MKKHPSVPIKIIQESTEEFFKRGREIGRLADEGNPIPESHLISSEDPKDFACLAAKTDTNG